MKKIIILMILSFNLTGCYEVMNLSQEKFNTHIGEIYGSKKIGQTFYYKGINVSKIKILMANYNRENTKDIILHFGYLKKDQKISSALDLKRVVVNAKQIKNNEYFTFQFSPIKTYMNKKYFFYLESPESCHGDAITLHYQNENVYKKGAMVIDDNKTNYDLTFKIYGDFSFFNNIVDDFLKNISKDMFFIILYGFLLMIIIGLFIKLERK